jgi:hypothetical protein
MRAARAWDRSRAAGWATFGGACLVALTMALTSTPPEDRPTADEATRRALFYAVASEETKLRRDAAKKFAMDRWSQDDDFHQAELTRARSIAAEHGVRLVDALSAIDDGVREGWPRPPDVVMRATVPPCQPRAIY